ncbi:formylglycine-generating enzyme family protein [Brucella gallinifaecis]|uniref:formylglycine-generating enzyme family protein n=1 Tax=Brucella gallinifaecis TaxID=215590 RepID=UPI00235E31CF|nr:formylglycine-generating enzyme family protein [Brucella gallinifaecis]
MKQNAKKKLRDFSIAIPAVLFTVSAWLFVADAAGQIGTKKAQAEITRPQMIMITPRSMTYRASGDFQRNNYPVDAPLTTRRLGQSFEIMKYQVTIADYALCVRDGICLAADTQSERNAGLSSTHPVVGVSYDDAKTYAGWLSKKTGENWHLPTDEQWAFAAGSRFADDALGSDEKSDNPALRWLRDYEKQSARKQDRDTAIRAIGSFGENEFGVADIGGNIWEWTATCHRRVNLDAYGKVTSENEACGVYVVNGKHRAAMSSFIRNPKSGGCSVGVPPDNLGFRLVRDERWFVPVFELINGLSI